MATTAPNVNPDHVARLVPGGATSLARLSDDELLAGTRRLVGASNQLLAALLLHLAEVETRGAHRTRSCASLYTYCIYELRFSEDAAARRSAAARFVKKFPSLYNAIAAGELHLTGLLMIGPHLTPENHVEVLRRAKFRTKKELAKLVRDLNPLPDAPDLVEPLGPPAMTTPRNPTWAEYVASLSPLVRELPPGERPRDWANDVDNVEGVVSVTVDGVDLVGSEAALPVGPVPSDRRLVTSPQRYQLQFSSVEEHVQLIERAKALLARERPAVTLGELHLEAMKLLVASLEKRKFAVGTKPQERKGTKTLLGRQRSQRKAAAANPAAEPETAWEPNASPPRWRGAASDGRESSRLRSRYVPAAQRREVYERDGGRCSYIDERGVRCGENRYLEIHHVEPFAKGGGHLASNLALRCAAHNALAAEVDFGQELVAERRDSARHESLARQRL